MNIQEELLREYGKSQTLAMANYIGNDPARFAELMQLFLSGEYRVTQRAAWVVSYCADAHPALIQPYLAQLITFAQRADVHEAVTRNVLRILQTVRVPEGLAGELIDFCFRILEEKSRPTAIRTFAMTVAYQHCQQYPELVKELKILVEDQLPYETPAFRSRGSKLLKQLSSR
jgi:hypothetical protein